MLRKEGNSQAEQNKKIEELQSIISSKQGQLKDYMTEIETLREWLNSEKKEVERLNTEQGKILVKKKESEMKMGDQSKKLEFVN